MVSQQSTLPPMAPAFWRRGLGSYPRYAYGQAPDAYLERAFALEAVCHRNKVPLAAAALQFSLRDPRITSTIVGISRPERVTETLELVQLPIAQAVWDEIAAL